MNGRTPRFASPRRDFCARWAATLLALLSGGCAAVHPSQEKTDVSVAAEYGRGDNRRNAPTARLDTSHATNERFAVDAATDPWWLEFDDERLNRLVSRVLESNTNLASAGLRLQQARLRAGLAFDDLLPQVDAAANVGSSRPLHGADRETARSSGMSASIGYEVDLWRKLRGQHDIANWEAEATDEDLQGTRLALIGDTCNLYWTVAFLSQQIVAGEQNLRRLEKVQQLVQSQFDAGAVSRLELREAAQSLESQRAAHSALFQQRVETRNALTVLLNGQPWPQEDEPQDLRNARMPTLREGLPAELLGRRPDLRAAELRLRQALMGAEVARVSVYPSISLNGGISAGAVSLGDILSNPVASLGAGLALPFLRLNTARLNTAIARKEYEIAVNTFRNALYQAFVEVDNALSADTELARQIEATQRSYDEAVEIERLYGARYRAGETALRSWLDAQETLRGAELSLAQVRLNRLQNFSTLFRALGGS